MSELNELRDRLTRLPYPGRLISIYEYLDAMLSRLEAAESEPVLDYYIEGSALDPGTEQGRQEGRLAALQNEARELLNALKRPAPRTVSDARKR